jgi:hypothetical protein
MEEERKNALKKYINFLELSEIDKNKNIKKDLKIDINNRPKITEKYIGNIFRNNKLSDPFA